MRGLSPVTSKGQARGSCQALSSGRCLVRSRVHHNVELSDEEWVLEVSFEVVLRMAAHQPAQKAK